jgi:aspartyl-tRNA(Asn)/glutamyl-tRNA(Gln) amidotransferase subunit A
MVSPALPFPTLRAARRAVVDGSVSAEELTRTCLDRVAALDPDLGAFLTIDADGALSAASGVDRARAAGETLGPLAGVPIALKDNLSTRGLRTTCASRMLEGYVPAFDATVVTRLRQAGAVLLGKLNMDEFAMGSSTENSAFRPTRNPWDLTRSPGGSSGGSAAAVAARLCFGALGSDTGGSIRQPAAFCGVVGLKPTYGRVSRFGLIAFASSLDQVGPLSVDVRDAAALFEVIAGHDPADATSAMAAVPTGLAELPPDVPLTGVRIGWPQAFVPEGGLEPAVEASVRAALATLEQLGAEIVPVSLAHAEHAIATYYIVATAEASSNLARFDGVRFGHRTPDAETLEALYAGSRAEGFGLEVSRRILLGTFALSAGYHDAFYGKASQVRALIRSDFEKAFERVDVIVTPTSPTTAFRLGERTTDPLRMYLADVFTTACNLAGIPGLSLPCGFDEAGLPIGLQIMARPLDEETLLRVAAAYEDAAGLASRAPTAVGEGRT